MLLKRFLHSDGIEKELALIFRFLRTAAIAARLRHVITPFLIQTRQLLEFFLEIVVRGRFGAVWAIEARLIRQFFEHGVCLHLLLNQIAQLEQRGLQDEKALLELRRENLLQGKILRLVHSVSGHAPNLPMQLATSKQFTRQAVAAGVSSAGTRSCSRSRLPLPGPASSMQLSRPRAYTPATSHFLIVS